MENVPLKVDSILNTLSSRIGQLEKEKAVLIEQVNYWREEAESSVPFDGQSERDES
ncbi:MAG: hypothetical protein ACQEWF_07750 [Bacillota bacterium]